MSRLLLCFALFISLLLPIGVMAQTAGGGGDDLKGVCELAGGTWSGVEGGNWACCWPDWGCYGCYNGNCKMQCRTARCRRANGMVSRPTKSEKVINGLAPAGMKAPVVPKLTPKIK